MIIPLLLNHFQLTKILVQSLSKYQIVNIDHVITCIINLDFNMHLSTQNPKLSPTIGLITCKYLYKSRQSLATHKCYMNISPLSKL